jgi:hypothetical protein
MFMPQEYATIPDLNGIVVIEAGFQQTKQLQMHHLFFEKLLKYFLTQQRSNLFNFH